MTDLEIVRLCAEAMGINTELHNGEFWYCRAVEGRMLHRYDPLTNKAQAMDLVFKLSINVEFTQGESWSVMAIAFVDVADPSAGSVSSDIFWRPNKPEDLLRVICLCAAKVQQAKAQTTAPQPVPQAQ